MWTLVNFRSDNPKALKFETKEAAHNFRINNIPTNYNNLYWIEYFRESGHTMFYEDIGYGKKLYAAVFWDK